MSLPTIIFDDGKGRLSPLTDFRPSFDIRTGALTTLERFGDWFEILGVIVPAHLEALTVELHPHLDVNEEQVWAESAPVFLVINGRAPLAASIAANLKPGEICRDGVSGDTVAACVASRDLESLLRGEHPPLVQVLIESDTQENFLLTRPWHIRTLRDTCLKADLDWHVPRLSKQIGWAELPPGALRWGTADLVLEKSATVWPGVFIDNTLGPIWIDGEATIRPGAIVCGPAYIGKHSTVLDRCLIKPNTVIGPHCKVAGEIGGTIFQGFANKAHDGHLGDSYVGAWANLGAGTNNSNLLNTYGEVVARPFAADGTPDSSERTAEQFLGAIIGDHAKFAISTRIMTGAIIGTGTMWAATSPVIGTVAPFSWVTDAGTKTYALNKFLDVIRAVMARRKLVPSEAQVNAVSHFHASITK